MKELGFVKHVLITLYMIQFSHRSLANDEVRASKSQTVYFNVIENPIDINLNLNVNGVDRKEAASGRQAQIDKPKDDSDCMGVTVGKCFISPDDITKSTNIYNSVQECQSYCNDLPTCWLFRFDGQNCTITIKDYRKNCQVFAGPSKKSIYECHEVGSNEHCALFLQEDCDYTGDEMDMGLGTIADPRSCQELCATFKDIGCKYWIYDQTNRKCSLKKNDEKTCKTWAGPRNPSFENCKNFS